MPTYSELTLRNTGYISAEIQSKIRDTPLLIAGCGIGSSFAEVAVRLGFMNLILADGDTIAAHNLNRQNFTSAEVGTSKVQALARRLRAINPEVNIQELDYCLTPDNVQAVVAQADIVFDTIDFLSVVDIVALHDECRCQHKPAITAFAIGWGAGCIYFPPDCDCSFRKVFGLPAQGPVGHISYVQMFTPFVDRLQEQMHPDVVTVVRRALTVMQDGTPCPASQVAPGGSCVGALGGTIAVRSVAGLPVLPAPRLLTLDVIAALTGGGIDVSV